jgi:hypothetical protein
VQVISFLTFRNRIRVAKSKAKQLDRLNPNRSMEYAADVLSEDQLILNNEIDKLKYKYKMKRRGESAFKEAIQTRLSSGNNLFRVLIDFTV